MSNNSWARIRRNFCVFFLHLLLSLNFKLNLNFLKSSNEDVGEVDWRVGLVNDGPREGLTADTPRPNTQLIRRITETLLLPLSHEFWSSDLSGGVQGSQLTLNRACDLMWSSTLDVLTNSRKRILTRIYFFS